MLEMNIYWIQTHSQSPFFSLVVVCSFFSFLFVLLARTPLAQNFWMNSSEKELFSCQKIRLKCWTIFFVGMFNGKLNVDVVFLSPPSLSLSLFLSNILQEEGTFLLRVLNYTEIGICRTWDLFGSSKTCQAHNCLNKASTCHLSFSIVFPFLPFHHLKYE